MMQRLTTAFLLSALARGHGIDSACAAAGESLLLQTGAKPLVAQQASAKEVATMQSGQANPGTGMAEAEESVCHNCMQIFTEAGGCETRWKWGLSAVPLHKRRT